MLKKILHVGCARESLPPYLSNYEEVRLDIDESTQPDIVANMVDLGDIGTFDVIYCCHALEHLSFDDAIQALKEFYRVLDKVGYAMIFVPDLQGVEPGTHELFSAPSGPITGNDLIYGHQSYIKDNPYMAHKCGFTADLLADAIMSAGFSANSTKRLEPYNLMGIAIK